MKYLLIPLLLVNLFFAKNLYAQDIIILKNGQEVESKIVKINHKDIRFSRYQATDEDHYSLGKEKIYKIIYENGEEFLVENFEMIKIKDKELEGEDLAVIPRYPLDVINSYLKFDHYEGEKRISRKEFRSKIKTNPTLYKAYTDGKELSILGGIIGIPAYCVLFYEVHSGSRESSINRLYRIGLSGLCAAGAATLIAKGRSKMKGSLDAYNASAKLGFSENGLGCALTF